MDRYTDWPWSWEEEVEWKADLEERDNDFLQELLDNTVEDETTDSTYSSDPEKPGEDLKPEEFFITA